jgi:cobalamin biosynthesis protein CobT
MASEDINVEYRNDVNTAAFNTENRTLIMPIFKDITDSTTDLFLGHEVGHALYTPEGVIKEVMKKGGSYKSLVNIVEDARIEKKIQVKFPGLSRNFYDGYAELMDKNFFGLNGRDVNDLNFIDRINIHFKIGTRASVEFTDEEQVFVDRIAKLRNWDETVAVADDLFKHCEDKQEKSETDMDDFSFESDDSMEDDPDDWSSDSYPSDFGDDDGDQEDDGKTSDEPAEDSNSDAPSDTDSSEDTGEGNNSVENKGDSEDEDSEEDTEEKENSNVGSKRGGIYDGQMSELVSETMDSFEDRLKDLVDTETEYTYGRVPAVDLDQIIVSMEKWNALIDDFDKNIGYADVDNLAKENFIKFRSENKSLVSYLAKEFEMRKKADEHKRTKVAKTGILNPNKLHSYKFNEDLFLRSEIVTAGKNHGFIMYLDWSGSMSNNMENTIDQLMLLALFCKKINVPFEAYAFMDHWNDDPDVEIYSRNSTYHKFNKVEINDIGINKNFRLVHLASSTLSTSKFQNSMKYLARLRMSHLDRWSSGHVSAPDSLQLGGTPLGECIISAINMVPEFQKKNNVQIVNTIFLTDGQGHNSFTVWDGSGFKNPEYRSTLVITDSVTKKHYNINSRGYNEGIDSILLKILSDRTKARVIGFYIAPTGNRKYFKREMGYSGVEWSKQDEIWNEMKKNNFSVLEDIKGYDQYIWVSSKSLNINANVVEIDSDMTKGRMKNAFVKQRQGKFGNKVMLSKLAEFVS